MPNWSTLGKPWLTCLGSTISLFIKAMDLADHCILIVCTLLRHNFEPFLVRDKCYYFKLPCSGSHFVYQYPNIYKKNK